MKAAILAAGVGARLGAGGGRPKALLRFGGKTLLERHVEILRHLGIDGAVIAVGYKAELVEQELARIGAAGFATTWYNSGYRRGSILSLWTLREAFTAGDAILFMDADVLYDYRLMERLLNSRHANCFAMDRDVGPGEDPVKLCVRDGQLVEFHKKVRVTNYDYHGEWVGFVRLSAEIARKLARAAEAYVDAGRFGEIYEEALRDVLLAEPAGTFGFEDITGLPWIEIDFPEDLRRAEEEILPRLVDLPR